MSDTPLKVAVEAALSAGRIQKERADNIGEIQYKGEINLVTEVDLLCEKEVIGRIQKAFPSHAFLAEESGATEGDADHLWIIDPLDGTVTQLNRQVALKILPDAFADDPDRLARFTREAQILASLNQPAVVAPTLTIVGFPGVSGRSRARRATCSGLQCRLNTAL